LAYVALYRYRLQIDILSRTVLFTQNKPIGVGSLGDDQQSEGGKSFHGGFGLVEKCGTV